MHQKIAQLIIFGLISTFSAHAAYPENTMNLVVSFAPGGATDITARIVAAAMSKNIGQQIVVENRPGAGGAAFLRARPPDGLTGTPADSCPSWRYPDPRPPRSGRIR